MLGEWHLLFVVVVVVVVVVIGDLECLEGTILDDASYFLTYGVASIANGLLARALGPRRAQGVVSGCGACGDSPLGQSVFSVLYVGSVAGAWTLLLPLASSAERIAAHAYAASVLVLFFLACWSDPGIVTPQNATKMMHLFRADGVLRKERACETCLLMRPARAKHHGRHCIAYFDHYCVWMRNAIGLFNLRYFLAFLLVTSVACGHGAVVGVRQVYRDIYVVRGWRPADHRVLFRVLANLYPLETALTAFMAVASASLFGFFASQLLQLLQGMTSYEYVKLRQMDVETRARYYSARRLSLEMFRIVLRPRACLDEVWVVEGKGN